MKTNSLFLQALPVLLASACSPALLLPPATEALDSQRWSDCAATAAEREGRSLIDDATMDRDRLLCEGVVTASQKGQLDDGLDLLSHAAVLDEGDHRAHLLRARILEANGRFEESLSAFERAHARSGKIDIPSEDLARRVRELHGDAAAIYFAKQAEARGLCAFGCRAFLAGLLRDAGDVEEAETRFNALLSEDRSQPAPFVGLAAIRHRNGEFNKEAALLKDASRSDGFSSLPSKQQAEIHFKEAFARAAAQDWRSAREAVERALAIHEEPEWWRLCGDIYLQLKDPAVATVKYDRALALDPGLVLAHVGQGDARMMLSRPQDAMASYRAALELAPDDAVVHLKLARAALREGDRDEARRQLEEAVELAGDRLPADLRDEITRALQPDDAQKGSGTAGSK